MSLKSFPSDISQIISSWKQKSPINFIVSSLNSFIILSPVYSALYLRSARKKDEQIKEKCRYHNMILRLFSFRYKFKLLLLIFCLKQFFTPYLCIFFANYPINFSVWKKGVVRNLILGWCITVFKKEERIGKIIFYVYVYTYSCL